FAGYDMLARVGWGGMGEIYKVRHQRTNRIVALKTVSATYRLDTPEHQTFLIRFRLEAEAISRLQHPHIVSIYDVGEHDGRPYFPREWLEGGSLAEPLGGRPQAERQAAQWVRILAQAVEYIHQAGIIHRDLKPANILLARQDSDATEMPTLKITDFGIAK